MAVARQALSPPPQPAPPDAPNIFALGTPGALESALKSAGFKDVKTDSLTVTFELESPRQYVEWLKDLAPPVGAMLKDRPTAEVERFWDAVAGKAASFLNEGGSLTMPNIAPMAVGTK